jgi:hypothetical protein
MTKPIVTALAGEWNIPTHFDPCQDYGKLRPATNYVTFGFKCQHCAQQFRSDYSSVGQFEASVEAFVAFAGAHRHVD